MSESKNETNEFPHIPSNGSGSFHSTEAGKVWVRLAVNLCSWLHDMYEVDSKNPDVKFQYVEQQINKCHALFPAKFTFMFSDPNFSSNDQHPLLICRQEEHKIIILAFRATVLSKSLQDVFTDVKIHSNYQTCLGARHSGFAQRVETAPVSAVVNWLHRGWKIIITGHSIGGAVSHLFTAQVISKLVEAGVSPDMVSLHCITFGAPQSADHHFWSNYTEWYDVFDNYIYGNDAIFRLATFGANITKKVIDLFVKYIQKLGIKWCAEMIDSNINNLTNTLIYNFDQILSMSVDALVPTYSIFGRHHFIRRNEKNQLKIDSIGELEDEKNRLLGDLKVGNLWYDYFIEKKMILNKYMFRDFMEHGCYQFNINQLFNQDIKLCIDKKSPIKQKLFRIEANNGWQIENQASDISANINFPDEISLSYIYFQGFLTDFIISVELPVELVEGDQFREKKPTLFVDQTDTCAVLCSQSRTAIKYLQRRPCFESKVKTYFGYINVPVAVLANFNLKCPLVYQLDPIQTVLRAYNEFILDTTSIEQIDSSLSRSFSLFFGAYKYIGHNEFDCVMARYWTEAEARKCFSDIETFIQNFSIPETKEAVSTYINELLNSLFESVKNAEKDSEEKHNADFLYKALKRAVADTDLLLSSSLNDQDEASVDNSELIPLHLDFRELRKCLYALHSHNELSIVEENLKAIRAPYLFTIMKLKQLPTIKYYTVVEKMKQEFQIFCSKKNSGVAGLLGISGFGATGAAAVGATGAAVGATGAAAVGAAVGATGVAAVGATGAAAVGAAVGATGVAAVGATGAAGVGLAETVAVVAAEIAPGSIAGRLLMLILPILVAGSATPAAPITTPVVIPLAVLLLGSSGITTILSSLFAPAQIAFIVGTIFGPAAAATAGAVVAAATAGAVVAAATGAAAAGAATGAAATGVAWVTAALPIYGPAALTSGVVGGIYNVWCSVRERKQIFGDYEKVMKPFTQVAIMVLASTESAKNIDENTKIWEILSQIANCDYLQKLTLVKSEEERDAIWAETFTKNPLRDISHDDRWYIVSIIQICCQLISMRQILARQPPKIVITGSSQTGKSTLFQYLTKRNVEQLRSNANFNTRMALQCLAFIESNKKSSKSGMVTDPGLSINIIDNPGYDDATGQAHILLDLALEAANLVILVTTLKDINQLGTIDQLHKILQNTHVNVLVLINQVDLRIKYAWEIFRKKNSYHNVDSEESDTDGEEFNNEFSLCETLTDLIKRPKEELIEKLKLKINLSIIEKRVTFQPVILKGFNELIKTFNQPDFRNEVHKSNINNWIKQNLLNHIIYTNNN